MSFNQQPLPNTPDDLLPLDIAENKLKLLRKQCNLSLGRFYKQYVGELSYETVKRVERGEKVRYTTAVTILQAYNMMLLAYGHDPLSLEDSQIAIQ